MLPRMAGCLLVVFLTAAAAEPQGPDKPRVDALGDALPKGAIARLGTLRFKHYTREGMPFRGPFGANSASTVTTAVFSPDGKRIASIGQPNQNLLVWDAVTGKEVPGPWNDAESFFVANASAFSPDGSLLAASGLQYQKNNNGITPGLFVWDIASAKIARMIGEGSGASALAFSADGKTLVDLTEQRSGQNEYGAKVRWFDVATGMQQHIWLPPAAQKKIDLDVNQVPQFYYQFSFALSPAALAVRSMKIDENDDFDRNIETELTLYKLDDGKQPGRVLHRMSYKGNTNAGGQRSVVFSADGKRVAFIGAQGVIELRDAVTGKIKNALDFYAQGSRSVINDMSLSPSGGTLAISGGAKLALWNQEAPETMRNIETPTLATGQALAFSPDGKLLVGAVGPDIRLFDLATMKELHTWEGHREAVGAVAFSADGRSLRSSGSVGRRNDVGDLITWDVASAKPTHVSSRRDWNKQPVGLVSPDHTIYLGQAVKDRLSVFQMGTAKLLGKLTVPVVQNLAQNGFFSPDGKFYVLPGKDNGKDVLRLYTLPTCKLQCLLPAAFTFTEFFQDNGAFYGVNQEAVAFSANGKVVAVVAKEDGRIHVIDTAAGKVSHRLGSAVAAEEMQNLGRRQGQTRQLEISADGRLLASWSAVDNRIRIWDLTTGKPRGSFPRDDSYVGRVRFAWSPDDRTLAIAKGKSVQIWEMATFKLRKEFTGHIAEIRTAAFSPDGRLLATGGSDTTVLIWDTRARD